MVTPLTCFPRALRGLQVTDATFGTRRHRIGHYIEDTLTEEGLGRIAVVLPCRAGSSMR